MSHGAWLTPDSPSSAGTVYRLIAIPLPFEAYVRGALGILSKVYNWERQGDMTPDDCADALAPLQDWSSPLIGTVHEYFTTNLPNGVLDCDGSSYNRVDYPDLYAVIDASLIDDADTFRTPDYTDRSPMGAGGSGAVGDTAGSDTHTQSLGELATHDHTIQQGYGPSTAVSVVLGALTGLDAIPTQETTSQAGSADPMSILHPVIYSKFGMIAR